MTEVVFPSGFQPASASTDPRAQRPAQGPKVKLKTFEGDPKLYKEWKREVDTLRFLYNIDDRTFAGMIYLALKPGEGGPRYLLSHMEIQDLCTADGMKQVFQILDAECVRESYVRSDEAQARYDRCTRKPGQSMEDFLREAKIAKRLLEKEDPGTSVAM